MPKENPSQKSNDGREKGRQSLGEIGCVHNSSEIIECECVRSMCAMKKEACLQRENARQLEDKRVWVGD